MDWRWTLRIVSSILLWTLCAVTEGFQWKTKETLIVKSCVGARVTIRWTFSLDPGESVSTIHWFRFARQTIASMMDGKVTNPDRRFVPSRKDNSVELTFGDVSVRDTGHYDVEVKVATEVESNDSYDYKGWNVRQKVYAASALLIVGEPPTITGEALTIEEVTSHEACALRRQVTLRCGHFTSRGVPPIEVVWTDPAGQQLPSTRFSHDDGTFDLDLPRRPLPGNYTCHAQCDNPALSSCMKPESPLLTSPPPSLDLRPSSPSQGCSEAEVKKFESLSSSGPVVKDSPTVQKLKLNLTELREKLETLQNYQKNMQEEGDAKEEHFFVKVEELRELVLLSNQQSNGAHFHILQNSFTDLQNKFWELQQNFTKLQKRRNEMEDNSKEPEDSAPASVDQSEEIEELQNSVRDLQRKLDLQENSMESMKKRVTSLSEGLSNTQQTFVELESVLSVLSEQLSALSSQHHSQNFTALWKNLERLEEQMYKKINSSLENLDLSGAVAAAGALGERSECCENLGDNVTRISLLTSSRLKGVEEGLGMKVDRVASQCGVTKTELGKLEWRMKKMEKGGGGGRGGGGGVVAQEVAMDQPAVDPLIALAERTFSLASPWDEKSDSLIHDFVITPEGHVIMADRHHASVIIVKNASSSDVGKTTTRALRYGTHIRRLTLMQNNLIAATVDDHYILILDINPTHPENEQRWIRTSYPYYGIATRSAQTLYAGASEEEVGNARVDVISVVNDVATIVSTIMSGGSGGTPQLRNPASLSLVGDDLYVSDWSSHAILHFSLETSKTTHLFGVFGDTSVIMLPFFESESKVTAILSFFQPRHTAFDAAGNMYVTTGGEICDVSGGGSSKQIDGNDDEEDHHEYYEEDYENDKHVEGNNNNHGFFQRSSESFCVVVISREKWWSRLIQRGKFVYPYGLRLTPTGLAVSWGMGSSSGSGYNAMNPARSLVQWYDLVPTNF